MRWAIEQAIRHEWVGLIDCVEIGVAESCIPVWPDLLAHLCLKSCDLRAPDVLKAVDHIRRTHPFRRIPQLWGKVHIFSCEVDTHIVADAVVEDADTRVGILCLPFDAHVKIDGFLGSQIRVACPPPAHACRADADGIAAVHLPVVP